MGNTEDEKLLPEPHDMQLPMTHWQRLPKPTFAEKHKNLPKILAIGLPLIVLLGVASLFVNGTYRSFMVKTKNNNAAMVPSAKPSVQPTMPDAFPTTPTTNWKTYDSKELGISFKYPNDWFVDSSNPSNLRIQNYDPKTAIGSEAYKSGQYLIHIIKDNRIQSKTNIELVNQLSQDLFTSDKGPQVITNEKNFTINGYTGYQREVSYPNSPRNDGFTTFILDGTGNVIQVIPALDVKGGKTYYDQIVSTITFIQKTANKKTLVLAKNRSQYDQSGNILNDSPKVTLILPIKETMHLESQESNKRTQIYRLTEGSSSYEIVIEGSVAGSCPWDDYGKTCSYTDESLTGKDVTVKTLRIWKDSRGTFEINPQTLTIRGYTIGQISIFKKFPTQVFSESEVEEWKTLLQQITVENN